MPEHDDCLEYLASRAPLTIRRRVLWGECDPAQVVYTPRFSDYLVGAVQWFLRVVLEGDGVSLASLGVLTPMKAMNVVYSGVLRPNDWFEMVVTVTDVRTRTFDLSVEARGLDGGARFAGLMTPIFVDATRFTGVPVPEVLRERLDSYRLAQAE